MTSSGGPTRVLWIMGEAKFPTRTGLSAYSQSLVQALHRCPDLELTVALASAEGSPGSPYVAVPATRRQRLAAVFSLGGLSGRNHGLRGGAVDATESLRLAEPDAVVIDHVRNSYALEAVSTSDAELVFVAHNHDTALLADEVERSRGLRRFQRRIDRFLTARAETRLARSSALVVTLTPEDAAAYRDMGALRALVVPPDIGDLVGDEPRGVSIDRPVDIAVVGAFHWSIKQNNITDFAEAFRVETSKRETPRSLRVIGGMSDDFADHLRGHGPAVEVVANPKAVQPHLHDVQVGVVPEFVGGGFKLKWLDYAWAGCCPVAASGSLAGLPAQARRAVAVADTPTGLAQRALDLADDPMEARRRAGAFQAAMLDHFDASAARGRLANALIDLDRSQRKTKRKRP